MTQTGEQPQRRITRLIPIVGWLPSYDRSLLRGDLVAGIVVTALIVPKNLGYAGIAGIPLQNGLYAAAAGAIVYALFCTSRQISTGPSSGLAAVAGGAVLATSLGGEQAAELVAAITLVTGLLFLLLAVFKLGRISQFLSKPVVIGFLAGAAVDVTIGELGKLTGTETSGDNAWQELSSWIGSLDGVDGTTLVVGLIALVVIFGLRVVRRRSQALWYWLSAACWRQPCSTSAPTGSPWSGTSRGACPRPSCRAWTFFATTRPRFSLQRSPSC